MKYFTFNIFNSKLKCNTLSMIDLESKIDKILYKNGTIPSNASPSFVDVMTFSFNTDGVIIIDFDIIVQVGSMSYAHLIKLSVTRSSGNYTFSQFCGTTTPAIFNNVADSTSYRLQIKEDITNSSAYLLKVSVLSMIPVTAV